TALLRASANGERLERTVAARLLLGPAADRERLLGAVGAAARSAADRERLNGAVGTASAAADLRRLHRLGDDLDSEVFDLRHISSFGAGAPPGGVSGRRDSPTRTLLLMERQLQRRR